jgi:signal peptidase I
VTPPPPQTVPIRYAEDVKEVLTVAEHLARKAKRPHPIDRDYFEAFLKTNRWFSRFDVIAKALGHAPKQIQRYYKKVLQVVQTNPTTHSVWQHQQQATNNLPQRAVHYLQQGSHGPSAPTASPMLLDVEHLWMALTDSTDPAIQKTLTELNISPATIHQATEKVRPKQVPLGVLYLLREALEILVVVMVFLVVIKEGLGELRLIPSESMMPLLQIEDRVVIDKLTRYWRPYERGDILVFYPPITQLKYDPVSLFLRLTGFSGFLFKKEDNIDVAYIKRLIGMSGDMVEVIPGQGVAVNGKLLQEPYTAEIANTCTFVQPVPYCGPVEVPKDHYFVMGDNRNHSADSRYWGFEPKNRVIGRAVFRIWPLNRVGPITSLDFDAKAAAAQGLMTTADPNAPH